MNTPETLRIGPEGTWVGIAANANSGAGKGKSKVERLAAALRRRGIEPRVAWTLSERSELVDASRRDPSCHCLVAAGGDGTVSDLINEQPGVPITVLPAGTENLFARHFGIRKRPEAVAETIVSGLSTRLDLGRADGRLFSLMAGVGFDADVVSRHHRARVARTGLPRPSHRAAYVEPVLRASWTYRFPPLTITISDPDREESLVGTTAFLFNLPRYALGLPFAPTALGDDGLLDLVVFRKPGSLHALRYLWLVLRGIHLDCPGVFHRKVARVAITTTEPVPVQLDGDPGGIIAPQENRPPWAVEVVSRAIDVLVPPSYTLASA